MTDNDFVPQQPGRNLRPSAIAIDWSDSSDLCSEDENPLFRKPRKKSGIVDKKDTKETQDTSTSLRMKEKESTRPSPRIQGKTGNNNGSSRPYGTRSKREVKKSMPENSSDGDDDEASVIEVEPPPPHSTRKGKKGEAEEKPSVAAVNTPSASGRLAVRSGDLRYTDGQLVQPNKGKKKQNGPGNARVPDGFDFVCQDGGKAIRAIFQSVVSKHPLYVGSRPQLPHMLPILNVKMKDCNHLGYERTLEEKLSAQASMWRSHPRRFLYLPGCTVLMDEQRVVAFAPKTHKDAKNNFSLKSPFDSIYGEVVELFFDNGLLEMGGVFYGGKYQGHRISDLHPHGFAHTNTVPWTLSGQVLNSQQTDFGQRLRLQDAARLIATRKITFEFIALQCVGFDMDLYHSLTGQHSLIAGNSSTTQTAEANTVQSTKKRRLSASGFGVSNSTQEKGGSESPKRKRATARG
ncbi:hypothetical protein V5O48_012711 [Marasmius crinis-equi]|uniref:Uncharacterized protein n=1 Tax=Marasmius crinis-equi TaxID=585013 RepID=A0ABR3F242_9AGAR